MKVPVPITLEGYGVRLEPLTPEHEDALLAAAADGELWKLWYTTVPEPQQMRAYIRDALDGQNAGHMLPWVVRELTTNTIVGCTRYHDIEPRIDRVQVGYTWYSASWQRTHVNTACKLLIFTHSFETLGAYIVALRTDNFNFASQRAIAALGAKFEGALRHHQARRDGSVRDSLYYSVIESEWPDVKRHLTTRLERHASMK